MISSPIWAQKAPKVDLKFGKGLQIMAADSSIYIKAGFRFQTLFQTGGDIDVDDEWFSNAVIRRARLKFDGWVHNPKLVYKVELALSNRDLSSSNDFAESSGAPKIVLDAVAKYKFNKNFEVWAGQTKLPGNRERVVSSQKLEFVDRSLVNSNFNIDRDIGIHLRSKFNTPIGVVKPIVAIAMGEGRNITRNNIGGYSYSGRIEYLPFGEFTSKGDYFEADQKREEDPKLSIGATYNLNEGASKQKQAGAFLQDSTGSYLTNDIQTIFVDAIFKYKGFALLGEFADMQFADFKAVPEGEDDPTIAANGKTYNTGSGYNVQLSYVFKNNWSPAFRYTSVTPERGGSFTEVEEYTFGISKYVVGHNLKVQTDVSLIDKANTEVMGMRYRLQFEIAF